MNRSEARAAALKLIYERRMGGSGGTDTREGLLEIPPKEGNADYMEKIFEGVCDNEAKIDEIISSFLRSGWKLERLSQIDLIVLEIAVYELAVGELPGAVVINEAIELAGKYSNPDICPFINGILASILRSERLKNGL